MATTLEEGDRVVLRVWCRDEEQAAVNSIWMQVVATGGLSIFDTEVATVWDNDVGALYKDAICDKATYLGSEVQILRPIPGLAIPKRWYNSVKVSINTGVGTFGSQSLPRQCSGLMSFKAGLSGPAFRGRNYIPFPSSTAITNEGEPTAPYVTVLDAIRAAIGAYIDGNVIVGVDGNATLVWGIHHRVAREEPEADLSVVKQSVIKLAIATQRRRGSLGKANKAPF